MLSGNERAFCLLISSLKTGGAEQCVVNLASSLLSLGMRVRIITVSRDGLEKQPRNIADVVTVLPITSVYLIPYFLAKLVDSKGETVFIASFWTITVAAALFCLHAKKPLLIYWEHAPSTRYTFFARLLINFFFHRVSYIIGWGGSIDSFIEVFPRFSDRTISTGNPIKFPVRHNHASVPKVQRKIVCLVGRIDFSKGILQTVYSFLLADNFESSLVIVGDGSAKLALIQIISSLNLSERVIFVGAVSDPSHYIRMSSVVCVLSEREGFCNVIIESLAVSTPIITLDNGSVAKYVIKIPHHGVVLRRNDVLAASNFISYYLSNSTDFTPPDSIMCYESNRWTTNLLEQIDRQ